MKKTLVALLLAIAMLLSMSAMAVVSPALPYEGDAIVYHCFGADLVPENKENAVYGEFQKLIGNVELDWEVVPISDIDTKNKVYLNSGEIPDLMWTRGNTSVIQTYGDMNYWLDLSPYMDEYMVNYKWWFENKLHMKPLIGENGEIYCVVDVDPYDYMSETWFYNKTALDALGYTEPPKTWDEMYEMMIAYRDANPDGIAMWPSATNLGGYMYYLSQLGGWETDEWYFNEETEQWDNAIVNGDSGYKDLVALMNNLYTEGLIHSEFDALSKDTRNQRVLDGLWLFGCYYHATPETEIFANGNDMQYELGTFTTPALKEGDPRYGIITVSSNSLGGWAYFAAAEVEKPEVMASLMDLCISEELTNLINWGIKGISYDVDENGKEYFLDDYATNKEKQDELGFATLHLGRMVHNSSWFVSFAKNASKAPVGNIAQDLLCDDFRNGELTHMLSSRSTPTFTTEENDTLAISKTPMNTYLNENVILFVTGDRPMDEWDAFVEEYKSMGNLEEVLSIYNNAPQIIRDMSTNFPDFIDN